MSAPENPSLKTPQAAETGFDSLSECNNKSVYDNNYIGATFFFNILIFVYWYCLNYNNYRKRGKIRKKWLWPPRIIPEES